MENDVDKVDISNNSLKVILKDNKISIIITSIFLISIYFYFVIQGVAWILFHFIFFVPLLSLIIGVIVYHLFNLFNLHNLKKKHIVKEEYKHNKEMILANNFILIIVIITLILAAYMVFYPDIKGKVNDAYLDSILDDIIDNNMSDHEKIKAVLNWFDRDADNMHNSWILNNQGKLLYGLPFNMLVFNESFDGYPGICIRCSTFTDGRWILTTRCGACDEYANLFMMMVYDLGYEVKRVKAPGEDHWWNEVKINGEWIPVDPTDVDTSKNKTGFKEFDFMEKKEGNISYAYALFPNNNTIQDRTSYYTDITNVTIFCTNKNNDPVSNAEVTITSHNLKRNPNRKTYIKDSSLPKTNKSGLVTFQIGGGNYTFSVTNNQYSGKLKWIHFSDNISQHYFKIQLGKR